MRQIIPDMAWMDYKKAYDMVPNISESLEMFGGKLVSVQKCLVLQTMYKTS